MAESRRRSIKYPKNKEEARFDFCRFRKRLVFDFAAKIVTQEYAGRRIGGAGAPKYTTSAIRFERLSIDAFGGDCESRLDVVGIPVLGRKTALSFDVAAPVSVLRLTADRLIYLSEHGRSSPMFDVPKGGAKERYEFVMPSSKIF